MFYWQLLFENVLRSGRYRKIGCDLLLSALTSGNNDFWSHGFEIMIISEARGQVHLRIKRFSLPKLSTFNHGKADAKKGFKTQNRPFLITKIRIKTHPNFIKKDIFVITALIFPNQKKITKKMERYIPPFLA